MVLRVWRKSADDSPESRLLQNTNEDISVGFVSIDLTVLMSDSSSINGWFNIIDLCGSVNGQIKVKLIFQSFHIETKYIFCTLYRLTLSQTRILTNFANNIL